MLGMSTGVFCIRCTDMVGGGKGKALIREVGEIQIAKQRRKGQEVLCSLVAQLKVWIYLSTHSCLVWLPEVLISPPVASFL